MLRNSEVFYVHLSWQEMGEKPVWGFKTSFDNEIVRHTPNLIIKLVLIDLTHRVILGKSIQMC